MVYRFNSPPNWPTPPAGWAPDAGWQPDPSWGPVPDGWSLWVDVPGEPAPATARKSRVGLVIGIVAGAAVLALVVAGGVAAVSFLTTPPDTVTVEGFESPRSVEEAKDNLQKTYDEAVEFLDSHHGIMRSVVLPDLNDALEDGKEQTSIDLVELRTITIMSTQERMTTSAEEWEEIWEGEPAFTDNRSGTDLEDVLDDYTGGTVDFAIDSVCGTATACVRDRAQNLVHLNDLYVGNPAYAHIDYADVLLHEFAHVVQFKYELELDESPDFARLFNSDVEFHADCMSLSLKPDFATAYGSVCTPEHLAAAKDAWDGVFTF